MMSEAFATPCVICGRDLQAIAEQQPLGGQNFTSAGHYGADWDPMDGSFLSLNVCDPCVNDNAERIKVGRTTTNRETTWRQLVPSAPPMKGMEEP